MSIFEQASRQKLRFDTSRGQLSAEDLWDLPLSATNGRPSLDSVAVGLHRALQDTGLSFVNPEEKDQTTQLKLEIAKHIIAVRKAEAAAAREEGAKAARKQKLLEVLARKQDAALEALSEDEIKKLIDGV